MSDPPADGQGTGLTRRRFLSYAGAGGTLAALTDPLAAAALQLPDGITIPPLPAVLTRTVRRREDFLSLTIEFRNLRFDNSNPRRLVKITPILPAYIVVVFPPQHLADEVRSATHLDNPANSAANAPGEIRSRLAGSSRLAFEVPAGSLPLAPTFDRLLDWVNFPQRVTRLAQPLPPPPNPQPPASHETAIEVPWFLVLSSRPDAGWAHARSPVTRAGRTELWHTRLGTRVPLQFTQQGLVPAHVDELDHAKRTVQAVWARDPNPNAPPAGPVLSLNASQRHQIYRNTSIEANRRPVQVNRLMLSTLGAWLDCRGLWPDLDLQEWRHRAVMGRDSFVRVVERGYLMPFGHKVIKTTISERQIRPAGTNPPSAYLVQRIFITLREPVKRFGVAEAPRQPHDGRGLPFRSVEVTTLTTPDLNGAAAGQIFVPATEATDEDVLFDCVAVDWEGQATELSMPMVFVAAGSAFPMSAGAMSQLLAAYNGLGTARRRRDAHGQKVAFAPASEAGDTTFAVKDLLFRVRTALNVDSQVLQELEAAEQPPFYPLLESAKASLSAVGEVAGKAADLVEVALDAAFVEFGLPGMAHAAEAAANNAGELFLDLVEATGLGLGGADKSGGIATLDYAVGAISRAIGPVGGLVEDARLGKFDPTKFLDLGAKLLGSVTLADIIAIAEGPHGLGAKGPKLQNTVVPKPPAVPQRVITRLDWAPDLKFEDPLKILTTDSSSSLTVKAEFVTHLDDPSASTFKVDGQLRNVKLNLFGANAFLIIEVRQLRFSVAKDKPPDVDPQLGEIRFAGPLKFVDEMRNFLSSLGKGFSIDVQPSGISAALSIPLPAISVGVFSLQNISIGLGATVPFNGDPVRFRFSFCSRENPFILTVSMFGGGGFFAIECGSDKSLMLELALEFGAAVAFDIGVASGGAEIMAGIYIKVDNDDALLSGYLRAGGNLSVLGLVRISIEIYLGFEYHTKSDKCVGEASFFMEIEIFGFITIPIKAKVRRAFGGEADPTFAQLMGPPDWAEYCSAYAPLGAP